MRLTIINNCEPEVRAQIGSFPTAKEAYDELKKAYEGKSVTELGALMKSVTRMNFDDRKITIQEHIADFGRAWNTFTAITARLDLTKDDGFGTALQQLAKSEKAKVEFLLDSLPPFYSNTIENIKSKEKSYDDTICKLIQYIPLRQKSRRQNGTKEDPVVLKTEKKPLDTSKKCKYCIDIKGWKGIGHTEAECYTKKREASKAKKIDEEEGNVLCIRVGKVETKSGYFQYDTAATHHTTNNLNLLIDHQPGQYTVKGHDDSESICKLKGTLVISHNGKEHWLTNCLYDSSYSDLISGQQINLHHPQLIINMKRPHGMITADGEKLFNLELDSRGGIWIRAEWEPEANIGKTQEENIKELHKRYGHISYDTLKNLPEYPKNAGKPPRCEACEKGKATKPPSPKSSVGPIRTKQPLKRLHCDLVGPIKPATPGKQYQYLLVVTDDYTRYMSVKLLKTKDETTNAMVEIVNILEKTTDPQYNVKFIQADWGGEFRNKDLQTELQQRGIQLKETVPRHSETNAVAERANRTIFTMSRTALIGAEIAKGYWDKASLWAVYTKNRLPHKSLLAGKTPIELLLPDIYIEQQRSNLRPFGQKVKCYDYEVHDKLSLREYEGRIIGYTNTFQTYWVLDPTGKTKLAKNPQPVQPNPEISESEDEYIPDDNMSAQPIPKTLMPDPEPSIPELPIPEDQEIDTTPEKRKRKKKDTVYWDETVGTREKSTRE